MGITTPLISCLIVCTIILETKTMLPGFSRAKEPLHQEMFPNYYSKTNDEDYPRLIFMS